MTELTEGHHPRETFPRLFPVSYPGSNSLSNVALYLLDGTNWLGEMMDLNVGKLVLDLRPSGHTVRSTSLNNVASSLCNRYKQLGDMRPSTLGDNVAFNFFSSVHPDRSASLNNVATHFSARYEQCRNISLRSSQPAWRCDIQRQAMSFYAKKTKSRPP